MIFHKISLSDFRNIENLEIVPGEKVNIICGENAQGKTNLMEALWLFTGAKSFRQTKDSEFIRFGAEKASLKADFFSENRDQNAEISFAFFWFKAFAAIFKISYASIFSSKNHKQ